MRRTAVLSLAIIIIVSLPLSGCGLSGGIYANYRPVGELRLIRTLGVDTDGETVTLSAAVSDAKAAEPPVVLRRSGANVTDAIRALQDIAPDGLLFFDHAQYIVLGRTCAVNGLGFLFDYVERDMHMRLGTELFLLRNGSAAEFLAGTGRVAANVDDMLSSIDRGLKERGDTKLSTFRETAVALSECGAAAVCALRLVTPEDRIFPDEVGVSAVPDGYGVLRGSRLVGFVEGDAAAAAGLLLGVQGRLTRSVPDGAGGKAVLEYSGSADVVPAWAGDGAPAPVRVRAKLTAAITELEAGSGRVTDETYLNALSNALSTEVAADLRGVLARSQALDADFLGLGRALRLSAGANFAALPDDWLQTLEFEVSVRTEIAHSHDLDDAVGTGGEAGR